MIGKADYQARGVLYLPESARFSNLLELPEGADIGKAINDGMRAIEADNEYLKDVLPKTYNRLDKELPVSLLKNFAAVPIDIEGDAFGKIYEYFLGKFAMPEGQKGGEFLHAHQHCKADRGDYRTVSRPHLRPGVRIGRHVRAVGHVRRAAPQGRNRYFDLRPGEGRRDDPAMHYEPCGPWFGGRHQAGRDGRQGKIEGRSAVSVWAAEERQRELSLDSIFTRR